MLAHYDTAINLSHVPHVPSWIWWGCREGLDLEHIHESYMLASTAVPVLYWILYIFWMMVATIYNRNLSSLLHVLMLMLHYPKSKGLIVPRDKLLRFSPSTWRQVDLKRCSGWSFIVRTCAAENVCLSCSFTALNLPEKERAFRITVQQALLTIQSTHRTLLVEKQMPSVWY